METEVKDEATTATHPVDEESLTDRQKFLVEKFKDFQRMCLDFFKTKGIELHEAVVMVDVFSEKLQEIVMKKVAEKLTEAITSGEIEAGVALVNTDTGEVQTVLGEKPPDEVIAKVMAEAKTEKAAQGVKPGNC